MSPKDGLSIGLLGASSDGMEVHRVRGGFEIRKQGKAVKVSKGDLEVLAWLVTDWWPELKQYL